MPDMPRDFTETSEQFLASLDEEIERLQTMRDQVAAALGVAAGARPAAQPKRKGMSEEGRRKIAEAQKARWAKQKSEPKPAAPRATAKKAVAKKTAAKKAAAKKTATKQASAKSTPSA